MMIRDGITVKGRGRMEGENEKTFTECIPIRYLTLSLQITSVN